MSQADKRKLTGKSCSTSRARRSAHLLKQLDAFDEGDGSLLDHSATVWFQEMSDGLAHNLNNLPIVQAGNASGYFKTGQAINVHDGTADLSPGNSELSCRDDGHTIIDGDPNDPKRTGTPSDTANAPINKYFCSLMNALGVKAGEDGFAAEGGTREVTHFGMYDETEDFIGGGTTPADIRNPGEFMDLKARS